MEKQLDWETEHVKIQGSKLRELQHGPLYKLNDSSLYYYVNSLPTLSSQEVEFYNELVNEYFKLVRAEKEVDFASLVRELESEFSLDLDDEQKQYLKSLLKHNLQGYGPLEFLLSEESLEEITILPEKEKFRVYAYHATLGWIKTSLVLNSNSVVLELSNKLALNSGKRLTLKKPYLNARLENGSRLHAVNSPVSFNGATLTIRKFKSQALTPANLLEKQVLTVDALAFLWLAFQSTTNTLIAGNTGSGKTTTLNALTSFYPLRDRLVLVEETPEIKPFHDHAACLTVNEELGVGMRDLVRETLRMRPDRVLIGEVRSDDEVKALLDTALAGQGMSSIATYHAVNASNALNRLKSSIDNELDLSALDLIVVQRRWTTFANGELRDYRKVTQVSEVLTSKSKVKLNDVFVYDYKTQALKRTKNKSHLMERVRVVNSLTRKEFNAEVKTRSKFLEHALKKKLEPTQFFQDSNKILTDDGFRKAFK